MIRPLTSVLLSTLVFVVLYGCGNSDGGVTRPASTHPPNILFLFSDDQTFATLGALGKANIATPNLDRLAARGTLFTHAYNIGGWNGAICMASRAMLNSGRSIWPARAHSQRWASGDTAAFSQSWSRLLGRAGYQTYMSGKWHVEAAADTLFQTIAHVRPGMPVDAWIRRRQKMESDGTAYDDPDLPPAFGYNRPLSPTDTAWSPTDTANGGFWEGGTHWSEVVRYDAERFLTAARTDERPFFMYLAFNAPHDPRQAPARFQVMYPVDSMTLPPAFRGQHPDRDAMGSGRQLRDEGLAPYPRTPLAVRTHRSEYYALITHLDGQIGHILDALEASGRAENTYVIFTSDHGLSVGNHGLIGKQNMYDHSIRVPFILAGPDIPAGGRIDTDIYLQDAMATVLDLAGVARPDYLYFNSVLPLLEGGKSHYPAIYGMYTDRQRMIRQDGYKLIVYPANNHLELYNLTTDPHELTNLAGTPVQHKRVKTMFAELVRLQQSMEDTLDISPVLSDYLVR